MKFISPQPPEAYTFNGVGLGTGFRADGAKMRRDPVGTTATWNLLWLAWPQIDRWLEGSVSDPAGVFPAVRDTVSHPSVSWLRHTLAQGKVEEALTRLRAQPNWKSLPITKELGEAWIDQAFFRCGLQAPPSEVKSEPVRTGNVTYVNFGRQ